MDDDLQRILEEARSGGQVHSVGRFSVDRVREADLLRRKRMVDPHAWVLKALQAAVAGDASTAHVTATARTVLVLHDGPTLTRAELGSLVEVGERGRATPRERAVRHLAVALEACLALAPLSVTVHSGDHWLRVEKDGEALLEPAPRPFPVPSPGQSHFLAVFGPEKRRLWGRWMAHQVRRLGGGAGTGGGGALRPEFHLVRERCSYAPIPVCLDEAPVNRPYFGLAPALRPVIGEAGLELGTPRPPRHRKEMFLAAAEGASDLVPAPPRGAAREGRRLLLAGPDGPAEEAGQAPEGRLPALRFQGEAASACYAAMARTDRSWSETVFVQDGVVVWNERNLMDRPGLLAVLSCRGLAVDLSEFAIVHDEAFHRRTGFLRKAALWMY